MNKKLLFSVVLALFVLSLGIAYLVLDSKPAIFQKTIIANVDVSGLNYNQAKQKLTQDWQIKRKNYSIKVSLPKKHQRLDYKNLSVKTNRFVLLEKAWEQTKKKDFFKKNFGKTNRVVQTEKISINNQKIKNWTSSLRKQYSVASKNASVVLTQSGPKIKTGKMGQRLVLPSVENLQKKLLQTNKPVIENASIKTIRPKLWSKSDFDKNQTYIVVNRNTYKLRIYKGFGLEKTYTVAVGSEGHSTPAGLYNVQSKQVNPDWHVPNSPWAGSLAGQVIPGGSPQNPLVARWIGVNGSVGIHGTNQPSSVGSAASHGCIRMKPSDVINLFPKVKMSSPVLIL